MLKGITYIELSNRIQSKLYITIVKNTEGEYFWKTRFDQEEEILHESNKFREEYTIEYFPVKAADISAAETTDIYPLHILNRYKNKFT